MNYSGYEPVIGLEIHIQSKTKSKMFCSCDANYFQSEPNSHTCPVCLGLPGALPVPNRYALDLAIKLSLALGCSINKETKFDRKNYFYPDLPKGFQISQYDLPIGINGSVDVETKEGKSTIGITRVHQEEDTGKSVHTNGETLLDFNKSGVPLIEVVSEPDFKSKEEVTFFAKRLRQIVRYLGISNADMERGEMRFELNMSMRKVGQTTLPDYKVEVKNIGSISVLEKVIDSEIERQVEILEEGKLPTQETRGLVDMSGLTVSQRTKEAEAGYRYFPEPDIPVIEISDLEIQSIKNQLVELPEAKKQRYISEYGIEKDVAENIIIDVNRYVEFEDAISELPKELVSDFAKWYTVEYYSLDVDKKHADFKLVWLAILIEKIAQKKITRTSAKEVLVEAFETGKNPEQIIIDRKLEVVSDTGALNSIVDKVITNNPKAVEDFKTNPNVAMFLVGQVMKEMGGKADVNIVREIVTSKLK